MRILFLLLISILFISCGKSENSKRCFTREEAITHCAALEMAEIGVTYPVARMLCEPHYPYNSCYDLSAKGK